MRPPFSLLMLFIIMILIFRAIVPSVRRLRLRLGGRGIGGLRISLGHAVVFFSFCAAPLTLSAGESCETALARMPLGAQPAELNRTNCVPILLRAFQSNDTVKALIFMPGATDEFYMFRRARAALTNQGSSLLDAVAALTNQTLIRVTFFPPLLLLHTDEDPVEPLIHVEHAATADKLQRSAFLPHVFYQDRDWDFVQPILK